MAPQQLTFGRIAVERVLKGDPRTRVVLHEAWGSWMCDTTTTQLGDRCLCFLMPGQISHATPPVRALVEAKLGDVPILRNAGSGDGLPPIFASDLGVPVIRFLGAPEEYGVRDARGQPSYDMDLAKVLQHVETLARFDPSLVAVRATSRRHDDKRGFDFRVLADGSTLFTTGARAPLRTSKLAESEWSSLRTSLTRSIGTDAIEFGDSNGFYPRRSLHVALTDARLSFADDESVIVSRMNGEEFGRYSATIDAWRLVYAAMNRPECVDHTAADEDALKR